MTRLVGLALVLGALISCAPCVEGKRDLWCHHAAEAGGPVDDAPCSPPLMRDRDGNIPEIAVACGPWISWGVGGEGSRVDHYFNARSGRHVATRYGGQEASGCDDGFWYGRRLQCEPSCAYGDHDTLARCSAVGGSEEE